MTLSPSRASLRTPENLSELIQLVDLNQLVSRYTGNGRTSGKVTTYSCPHPAHPDTHPSFTVTTNGKGKEVAKCFSQCAWQGDALELVKWLEGLSTGEAASWLRRFIGQAESASFVSKAPTPTYVSVISFRGVSRGHPGEAMHLYSLSPIEPPLKWVSFVRSSYTYIPTPVASAYPR